MYDDSIGSSNYSNVHRHWYDEPPYESDPDDFLMTGMGAAAKIQVRHRTVELQNNFFLYPTLPKSLNFFSLSFAFIKDGRVCFTNGPGVISLRSAGDISVSQQRPVRGLIVPQQPPNPPTIIPLKR